MYLLERSNLKIIGAFETPGRQSKGYIFLDTAHAINFNHLAAGAPVEQYATTIAVMNKLHQLGPITATPVIAGKTIFIAANDGNIYAMPIPAPYE